LSDQECHHELPALPLAVDHRAGGANGSWLPAFYRFALAKASVPGLRPASYINQTVSLARRRVIHIQRVAALRDLISAA
jgi:hypothetical protein